MQYVIRRSGIENALVLSKEKEDTNSLENVFELVGAVENFIKDNPNATIADFMQSVALVSDTDEMDDDNYVTIATVHAVKGLEFDTVFLPGWEEGLFPHQRALDCKYKNLLVCSPTHQYRDPTAERCHCHLFQAFPARLLLAYLREHT